MTYAIVEAGGKQYRVASGDLLDVDRFAGEKGSTVEWTNVLLYRKEDGPVVGTPVVPDVKVTGTVVYQGRRRSITVFKKKRRKNYIRTKGHRQYFTRVRIDEIVEN
ncbi:MAG: 50S ribosomal protein L21 [Nitrospiraceae bacterium]|nr:50S ribosomal protein L21 [Nitrospiraceae bacterium]|tara:strand:- start:5382 stop:5699 length:318 start_codon:yes stop_codon:yes gene_type:complete